MGVYRFDENGIIYLATSHPGVAVEQIKENCSFDLNVSRVTGDTPSPTYKELFVLREFVDPELIFLPQKGEYPKAIQSLIAS
jgi:glutaconate CoA-transferase subunit B